MSYRVAKERNEKKAQIEIKKIRGFKIKPLNNIEYDGVKLNKC